MSWILHNLSACHPKFQIDEFQLLLGLIDSCCFTADASVRRLAVYSLERASNTPSDERLKMVGKLGCVHHLLNKLGDDSAIPVMSFMKTLGNLLSASDDELMNSLLQMNLL